MSYYYINKATSILVAAVIGRTCSIWTAPKSRVASSAIRVGILLASSMWLGIIAALVVAVVRDATLGAQLASSKDLMAPAVAATGVLIAVMAFARDKGKIERDRAEARSKILFEQCKQGLDSAYSLLKDCNNDRITWIRAARLLASVRMLSTSIASEEYGLAYRLAEDDLRARLYEVLSFRGDGPERNPLPPAFFYGIKDWTASHGTLDAMAMATSGGVSVHAVNESTNVPEKVSLNLNEQSVRVIMGFLDYPADYVDVLDEVDWKNISGWSDSHGPKQGACRYLDHKRRKVALNGRLFDRTTSV